MEDVIYIMEKKKEDTAKNIWELNVREGTRREFLREILYKNIAIIAIRHSKMYCVYTFGDFSYTVEWN